MKKLFTTRAVATQVGDGATVRLVGRMVRILAAGLASALVLTSCLQDGTSSSGAGSGGSAEGVSAGASKQEYVAALEELGQETITIQSTSPKGEGISDRIEEYAQTLEEWSGGKLTVEIAYGNSIASPDEAPQALAEGRLDMDYVYPLYDPSRFPKNAAFADISFVGDQSPVVGMLGSWAGLMQAGLKEGELQQEFEEKGLKLLLPFTPQTSNGLLCTKPLSTLADLNSAQVGVSGGVQDEQVKALGAGPTSLAYSELFEALERGVINCSLRSASSVPPLSLADAAPNFTTGSDAVFAPTTAPYAIGLAKWESMALPYRQLIYDRLQTLSAGILEHFYIQAKRGVEQMRSGGGEIQQLGAEADAALEEKNQELLDQLGDRDVFEDTSLAVDAEDAVEKWQGVAEEMGFSDATLSEFAEAGAPKIDASEFVERFWSEVASEYRPE